jgi:hypothetical protein
MSSADYLNKLYVIGKNIEKQDVLNNIKEDKWNILKLFFEKADLLLIDGHYKKLFANKEGVEIIVKIKQDYYLKQYVINLESKYIEYNNDFGIFNNFTDYYDRFTEISNIAITETIKDDFLKFIDEAIMHERENLNKIKEFVEDINNKFASHLAIKELEK